jgi:hypothetical protein
MRSGAETDASLFQIYHAKTHTRRVKIINHPDAAAAAELQAQTQKERKETARDAFYSIIKIINGDFCSCASRPSSDLSSGRNAAAGDRRLKQRNAKAKGRLSDGATFLLWIMKMKDDTCILGK